MVWSTAGKAEQEYLSPRVIKGGTLLKVGWLDDLGFLSGEWPECWDYGSWGTQDESTYLPDESSQYLGLQEKGGSAKPGSSAPTEKQKASRGAGAGYKCQGERPMRQTNGLQWARQTAGNHRRTSRSILVR